ncbi:Caffeic acid 3-O-methyltransferase [Sesamum angolense]|uniref:Caffeic acid 3-O-methyltransferase n=1 Tax=Sesamum angolense TaxID=2727404 RepID=A0AAE1WD26_9LAMI|nr:Caffeic acid 3-O-methyltransferase [Sesamum angolense]
MENYKHGEDEEAGALALAACVSHIFPMALDAAIQLDLFEIIARAGVGALLSPSDIVSQLSTSNEGAGAVLDSLLRLLATHSLLTCSVSRLENGGTERRYGLAPAGKFFVGDENGVSFAQFRALTSWGEMQFRHRAYWWDMFVEVPKGDAILLKFILHNWSDEKCIKLLKNCYEALPNKGKLIVMDYILPNSPQTDIHAKYVTKLDVIMSTKLEGKERTKDEFETLATKVGFAEFKVVCCVYGMWIMEFIKSI